MAAIARRDASDRWLRLALLSSCLGRAGELYARLAADEAWRTGAAARTILSELAQQVGLQNQPGQVADVLAALDQYEDDEQALSQATVRGLSEGLARAKSPLLDRLTKDGASRAGQLLDDMIRQARAVALDEQASPERRADAVRSLAPAPYEIARQLVPRLLEARQPQEVQVAAVQTLSRFDRDDVARILVDA
jgi:hypothetical protein